MKTYNEYHAEASTIKIEDILPCFNVYDPRSSYSYKHNQEILRQLKDNDPDLTRLCVTGISNFYGTASNEERLPRCYATSGAHDLGWLGYFIAQSTQLHELLIDSRMTRNFDTVKKHLCDGINRNISIKTIRFDHLSGGSIFQCLDPFFKSNKSLSKISLYDCDLGSEDGRLLSLAIAGCNKSLKTFTFDFGSNDRQGIASISFVDIIVALSMHPNLEELNLHGLELGRNECTALSTLLKWTATKLHALRLNNNRIGDVGMECLAHGIASCKTLQTLVVSSIGISDMGVDALSHALAASNQVQTLDLYDNPSITSWQSISSLLSNPNCNLKYLHLGSNNIGDEDATMFADALVNNKELKRLYLGGNQTTAEVWQSFSKLLCDTSSVNNTFLSNHTLVDIGFCNVTPLFWSNRIPDKKKVATMKILMHHPHLDLEPLFEWDLKTLPLVMGWFERAEAHSLDSRLMGCYKRVAGYSFDFEAHIGKRRLYSIYQFIRGVHVRQSSLKLEA